MLKNLSKRTKVLLGIFLVTIIATVGYISYASVAGKISTLAAGDGYMGRVDGRIVYNNPGKNPVTGITVEVQKVCPLCTIFTLPNVRKTSYTDSNGYFLIQNIPGGKYTFTAHAPCDVDVVRKEVQVSFGQITPLNQMEATLRPLVKGKIYNSKMYPTQRDSGISGVTITDWNGNNPIGGLLWSTTDSSGTFIFDCSYHVGDVAKYVLSSDLREIGRVDPITLNDPVYNLPFPVDPSWL